MEFRAAQWSNEAEHMLAPALGADAEAIGGQVRSEVAHLWHAPLSGSWMITRVDGLELVVVAYAGRGARAAFRQVYAHAKAAGLRSVRFHTQHAWLIDLIADWQPEPLEYVVRVKVEAENG